MIERPYLRDGVDVYVRGDRELHFVYLASRKRVKLWVEPYLIQALSWLDGRHSITDLLNRVSALHSDRAAVQLSAFLGYLEREGVVVDQDWAATLGLPPDVVERQQRQLAFLLDILGTPANVAKAQERILAAKLVFFGVGAVGGWILRQLLDLGFRRFVLIDHDVTNPEDITRHAFATASDCDCATPKAESIRKAVVAEFPKAEIQCVVGATSPRN